MKWLRFAGQYINTGIIPQSGYRVVTQIKSTRSTLSTLPVLTLFGSCLSDYSNPFCLYFLSDIMDSTNTRFRADYASNGSETDLKVDLTKTSYEADIIYDIDFGKNTIISGMKTSSQTTFSNNGQPIFIGSVNKGGTPDPRPNRMDYGEFTILDASGVEVFHGVPVKKGSTEYSNTPAPSNCYFDMVSKTYKLQSGGGGTIGYMDNDRNLTQPIQVQHDDYGVKILDTGEYQLEFMNSKYRLLGADITIQEPQFKTFEVLLGGYHAEPQPSYPGYIENWEFYNGSGVMEREALTIDTGLPGDTLKLVSFQTDKIDQVNYQARAHQYTTGGSGYANTYLTPTSKTLPLYLDLPKSKLEIIDGNTPNTVDLLSGQGGFAKYNTLAQFNAGSVDTWYSSTPTVKYKIMPDGKIKIFTSIPYNWIQRAGPGGYRVRWKDWVWFQGVRVRLTVLNTPYKL